MALSDSDNNAGAANFTTTRWSVVWEANNSNQPAAAADALEKLCVWYWYPLYSFVRRKGYSAADAEDLTQDFFARLLDRQYLRLADQRRGRFRTFLLGSLDHFLINEWKKGNRQKRGGGRQIISLDKEQLETRFQMEPADHRSPDKAFDRRWTLTLLERVLDQLEREFTSQGRGDVFEVLKASLTGEKMSESYLQISQRLGMSESNLKVTVSRFKKRYRELIREEIGRTVEGPAAVDEEMRYLMAALAD